jgi:hypothetical protein
VVGQHIGWLWCSVISSNVVCHIRCRLLGGSLGGVHDLGDIEYHIYRNFGD